MKNKYVMTDYDGCPYITAGKAYEVSNVERVGSDYYFDMESDTGAYMHANTKFSPHLHGNDFYFVDAPKKECEHVRPIMTTEARDILDGIHETIGAETRSDSIVKFMEKNTELGVELCAVKVQLSTLEEQSKRHIDSLESRLHFSSMSRNGLKSECSSLEEKLKREKFKRKGWMIYSAIVAVYAIGVSIWHLMQ